MTLNFRTDVGYFSWFSATHQFFGRGFEISHFLKNKNSHKSFSIKDL